jgi:serine/threonine-protein kinase
LPNLIVERGREKGSSFELKPDAPCVAGRDPASVQIVLSDPASSRRHFQVAAKDGKWFVTDLGSKNSTYLNSEKLSKETELNNGDNIQVGETVLSFIDEDKADKSAAQGLNGKEIGGYKILDRLGRGGMGTVFKAKQISLNRVIALKVLASKFAKDPKFVERFQSEARAAGQLNHPNVVQVFDVGQLGGLHFFSMELMEGGCVQDLLSAAPEGRLSWQEAMPLIVDAARGLVFAEKRGIIHRDIKPDNLMLTSEQRVKIGDLGLAKKAEDGVGDKQIFGTPHFIAPEQAQGKEITHAADLYALGATFYRMVTGKTPFNGETVKDILKKQINDPHQPVREIIPDFPEDLAAIVDKLMAKKVENRYQSATKLVEDLEAFQLAHQIELAGGSGKKVKPFLYAALVLALAGIGYAVWLKMQPEKVITKTEKETQIVKEMDPEAIKEKEAALRRAAIGDARNALLTVNGDDRALGDVTLDKKAKFEEIAARYEALAKDPKFADSAVAAEIQPGVKRAKEIRDAIERLEADKTAADARSQQWLTGAKSKIAELEKAKKWSEAIRTAKSWVTDAEGGKQADWLKGLEAHEVELAQKDLADTTTKADEKKTAGDVEAAVNLLQDWAAGVEADVPVHEQLKTLATTARESARTMGDAFRNSLQTRLDEDKLVYVDAVRGLHKGGSGLGVIFDLQFEAAAAQVEAATTTLQTYPYKDRAARLVARLRAAQKGWADWVQLLADGKLYAADEEIKGLPGVKEESKARLKVDEKPTIDKFTVRVTGPGGTVSRRYEFAEFSREELWTVLVAPKVDKLPGDVAAGLAWLFAWLGHDDAAQPLLDRARAAAAQMSADDETALAREIATVRGFDDIRKKQGGEPTEVIAVVDAWRKNPDVVATDSFVLLDGRAGKDTSFQILPTEMVDAFLANLGKKKQ